MIRTVFLKKPSCDQCQACSRNAGLDEPISLWDQVFSINEKKNVFSGNEGTHVSKTAVTENDVVTSADATSFLARFYSVQYWPETRICSSHFRDT